MWIYLLQGVGYGLAAASQPGPFQTYLISQTLTHGWRRTLPAALTPLLSDGPIILLCVLVLSQVPTWMQRGLYIAGGLFILYLAHGIFNAWKNFEPSLPDADPENTQGLFKAAMMNVLNPNPYIFWTLVTGPVLIKGWRETPIDGIGFLVGFYGTLISSLAVIILVFGTAARMGPKVNRVLLGVSASALFGFGLYQLWLGIF
ncbi:MAG: LysE family transporter [Chloroflexi bacterium]|nr:LysE family transporter [Chloroflexota bacterium]